METFLNPRPSYWAGKAVVVTGGAGFLGSHTVEMLESMHAKVYVPRSAQHDLTTKEGSHASLAGASVVIHLAANVGGIAYNRRRPASLAHDNLAMGLNVFEACHELGVEKLVAACSVCGYPERTPAPFKEDDLWRGFPEKSSAAYGAAKRMLPILSEAYREQYGLDSCVPVIANLYGPGDDFSLEDSHVVPAMIRKFAMAAKHGKPEVELWGSGKPSRDFLYVEDAARALLLAAEHAETSRPFNVGTGIETKVCDLAQTIRALVRYEGETVWNPAQPDGQQTRVLDVSRAAALIGFRARVSLADGLRRTIASFMEAIDQSSKAGS